MRHFLRLVRGMSELPSCCLYGNPVESVLHSLRVSSPKISVVCLVKVQLQSQFFSTSLQTWLLENWVALGANKLAWDTLFRFGSNGILASSSQSIATLRRRSNVVGARLPMISSSSTSTNREDEQPSMLNTLKCWKDVTEVMGNPGWLYT